MMRGNKPARCAGCPRFGAIAGRGLCGTCYDRARRTGTLIEFPLVARPTEHTVEDWEELKAQGYTKAQAAERLHMSTDALSKALSRVRRRQAA